MVYKYPRNFHRGMIKLNVKENKDKGLKISIAEEFPVTGTLN